MTLLPITHYDATGGDVAALVAGSRREQFGLRGEDAWPQAMLRLAHAGSAGVVVLISGYGPYWPRVGTSLCIVDNRSATTRTTEPSAPHVSSGYDNALTLSGADQARELLAALALNKSQLAEVLGVSRPTLYDWFDGKEPNLANAQRMTSLLRLLARAGVTSSSPLNARFVRQPLGGNGPSLLELLGAEQLDEGRIERLLRDARSLGEAVESRRRIREERLRALGYDEPSEDQRKKQLEKNIAMRDWPKR